MDFSIITPSYNSLRFLPMACASVADQSGVSFEHIIADGQSEDGTIEWLGRQQDLQWFSRKDGGMYDAINKGFARSQGEILGYLNCDEQYLPGALLAVKECFERHPSVDVIYGDMLVTDPQGGLLAFRKSYPLRWPYVMASHLYIPSCALFWRRGVVEAGFGFDPRWQMQGDADFMVRILQAGYQAKSLRRYLAAFVYSGANLGATPAALAELEEARQAGPWWIRRFRWMWNAMRLAEKCWSGAYRQGKSLEYQVFVSGNLRQRQRFLVASSTFRWPGKPS